MALIILDPNTPIPYVPISERGKKDPLTIWVKYVNRGLALQQGDQLMERLRGVEDKDQRNNITRTLRIFTTRTMRSAAIQASFLISQI
jgi:hypothetical protein